MNTNVNCSFINYTTNLHKSQFGFFTFTDKCGKIYELKSIKKNGVIDRYSIKKGEKIYPQKI